MKKKTENQNLYGGYITPQVNVIQMVTCRIMATSWNNGEINGDPDDLYDEEL